MSKFFDQFPKTLYDIEKGTFTNYKNVTNITFRIAFIRDVLSNIGSYYFYTINEGDTPEILAEKIYNNPEAHWMILYANEIYDPLYDWPLAQKPFYNYVANKYRTIAANDLSLDANTITDQQVISWTQDTTNANSVHHYEKQIIRINTTDNITTTMNLYVNKTNVTSTLNSSLAIANTSLTGAKKAWQYYTGIGSDPRSLTFSESTETYNDVGGKTVTQTTKGAAITYYDYENEVNENKRQIKIIKAEYYEQIISEFAKLNGSKVPYIRKLV